MILIIKDIIQLKVGDNAEALVSWIKNNKELVKKRNQNGLKIANLYWKEHPTEKQKQLERAHAAARKSG